MKEKLSSMDYSNITVSLAYFIEDRKELGDKEVIASFRSTLAKIQRMRKI